MNYLSLARVIRFVTVALLSPCLGVPIASAQATSGAVVEGTVCDLRNHAPAVADIIATSVAGQIKRSTKSGRDGQFRLQLPAGTYSVTASLQGWRDSSLQISLVSGQTLSVQFVLEKAPSSDKKSAATVGEFSDAPNYTVSGITDPTNLGGHGSDTVVRTRESLARATASLNNSDIAAEKQRVAEVQKGPDTADLHALLGDIAEHEGRPLDAVEEYQKAAAITPIEPNLFALGAELLLHGAAEPAAQTFANGAAKYPASVRLALGRATAVYTLGREADAAELFAAACDIQPANPEPYLFLGRLQAGTKAEPAGWTERLARFANANPTNASAQYNYAVALGKDNDPAAHASSIEALLRKAILLDPTFGEAYLQLGIFHAKRGDFAKAIPEFKNAIANTMLPDEAHFRIAEAYRRTGEPEKAKEEIQLYLQISKEKLQQTQEERNKIPQFIYTLRDTQNKR
jgi:tetratricopeptide (TPR) repeat protein